MCICPVEHAGRDDRHRSDGVQIGIEVGSDDHHDSQMLTQELSDNDEDEDGIDTNQGILLQAPEVLHMCVFMYGNGSFRTLQNYSGLRVASNGNSRIFVLLQLPGEVFVSICVGILCSFIHSFIGQV